MKENSSFPAFHDRYFFFSQAVQLVYQFIDTPVGRFDLPGKDGLFLIGASGGKMLVQVEHRGDKGNKFIVLGFINRVNWNFYNVLVEPTKPAAFFCITQDRGISFEVKENQF